MKYLLMMIFFSMTQCKGQMVDDVALKAMKKESYTITNIDLTEHYYILKGLVNKTDSILLVVDKKSKQLKKGKIEVGKTYSFEAYRFYDVFALNADMCHNVDNKEIWCHSDNIDLRFTDGMGNETARSVKSE